VTLPDSSPGLGSSNTERAYYSSWLGDIAIAAVQGKLLQTGAKGLQGAKVDTSEVEALEPGFAPPTGYWLGTPPATYYTIPSAGLSDSTISAGIRSRASAAGLTVETLRILSLGDWKAVAIVASTGADVSDSAASSASGWATAFRAVLPDVFRSQLVGYYFALENATGSLQRLYDTAYLTHVSSTYMRHPDLTGEAVTVCNSGDPGDTPAFCATNP
jgi:hypothetical protein